MDQQIQAMKMQETINIFSETFEDEIIGKNAHEVENLLPFQLENKCSEEYIFIVKTYLFGIFRKKLHVYFYKGLVRDYFIG